MTGFICLDKPENMTSFTAANLVRKITGAKKAGHTGTLDPMATGVLPVAVDFATRFIELLPVHDKAYRARVRLGMTTDTLDITGTVTGRSDVAVTENQILEAVHSFSGDSMQTPPMYSAISRGGVRLYDLARKGLEVERTPRSIRIHSICADEFDGTAFTLTVFCSAGTYIRSLADDIGKKLGCGAVLTALRRIEANGFSQADCVSLEALRQAVDEDRLQTLVKPVDAALDAYAAITVTAPQAKRFQNGGDLFRSRIGSPESTGYYRVYDPDGGFLGIGEITEACELLTVKRVYVGE